MATEIVSRKRRYCSVFGCLNSTSSTPELSFFTIPYDYDRRLKWLQLISRVELLNKFSDYRVCEVHFKSHDIQAKARKLLKKSAVPSLRLPIQTSEDKETQTDISTIDNSSQTESMSLPLLLSSQGNVNNTSEKMTSQTDNSVSVDTPNKRKLRSRLLGSKKRLKEHAMGQTTENRQEKDVFRELCDRLLPKDLAELVKGHL